MAMTCARGYVSLRVTYGTVVVPVAPGEAVGFIVAAPAVEPVHRDAGALLH